MTVRQVRAEDPVVSAEEIIQMRAESHSKIARINKFFEQYSKVLIAILIAIGGWFMKDVVKPLQAIPAVVAKQEKQDSVNRVLEYKLDTSLKNQDLMAEVLEALAGLQCEQSTPRERRTSILCKKITTGEGL